MLMKVSQDRNQHFEDYSDLIYKMAKNAWGRLQAAGVSIDFEDVYQEMCVIYCRALETYNPETAKFSTYLWNAIRNDYNKVAERLIREACGEMETLNTYNEHDARAAAIAGVPYEGKTRKSGKFCGVGSIEELGDAEFDAYEVLASSGMTPEEELISSRFFSDGYRMLNPDSRAVVKTLLKQAILDRDEEGNVVDPEIQFCNSSGVVKKKRRSEMKLNEIMMSMRFSRQRITNTYNNIEQAFGISLKGDK